MAIVNQLIGPTPAAAVQAAIQKIRTVININQDIKSVVDAAVGASMPKTQQELANARIAAIANAMSRNPAFATAITEALKNP
jgi:hypothetical protein